jgi:hypothetical protein
LGFGGFLWECGQEREGDVWKSSREFKALRSSNGGLQFSILVSTSATIHSGAASGVDFGLVSNQHGNAG